MRDFVVASAMLFAVVFLSACSLKLVDTSMDDPRFLPEDAGVVVVALVTNRIELSPMIAQWDRLKLINADDPNTEYLVDRFQVGNSESSLFMGALPSGTYRLKRVFTVSTNYQTAHSVAADIPESLGSFVIAEDRVTNLGTVVFQPLSDFKDGSSRSRFEAVVVRLEESNDFVDYLSDRYADFSETLDLTAPLGWQSPSELPESLRAMTIQRARRGFSIHTADGTTVMPSALGQIFWRRKDTSDWQRSSTGVINQIEHLSMTPDGLLAVGERGLVMVSSDWDAAWTQIPGPGRFHLLTWGHRHSNGTIDVLSHQSINTYWMRWTAESRQWHEMHRFSVDYDIRDTARRHAYALIESERILIFAERRRHEFNLNGELIETRRMPGFSDIYQQRNGTIMLADMDSRNDQLNYSRDGGANWQRAKRFFDQEGLVEMRWRGHFVDDEGKEWRAGRRPESNPVTGRIAFPFQPQLRYLAPDSERIQWQGTFPLGCESIYGELSTEEHIHVLCGDGRVMSTHDQGDHWQLEIMPYPDQDLIDQIPRSHITQVETDRITLPPVIVVF